MISDEDLRAMRARCDAATKGPWKQDFGVHFSSIHLDVYEDVGECIEEHNAAFCVHARTDLPRCLDEIKRLRKALTWLAGYYHPESVAACLIQNTLDGSYDWEKEPPR